MAHRGRMICRTKYFITGFGFSFFFFFMSIGNVFRNYTHQVDEKIKYIKLEFFSRSAMEGKKIFLS